MPKKKQVPKPADFLSFCPKRENVQKDRELLTLCKHHSITSWFYVFCTYKKCYSLAGKFVSSAEETLLATLCARRLLGTQTRYLFLCYQLDVTSTPALGAITVIQAASLLLFCTKIISYSIQHHLGSQVSP